MTWADDLRGRFRDEADERIDEISRLLMLVERGEGTDDTVNALLRQLHSIKGAAGMVDLDAAYALAHAIEGALAPAREGGRIEVAAVPVLLEAVDALQIAIAGDEQLDQEPVLERLAAIRSGASPPSPAEGAAEPEPQPASAPTPQPEDPQRWMRVNANRLDSLLDEVGEAGLEHRRLRRALEEQLGEPPTTEMRRLLNRGGERLGALQSDVIELRTLPLAAVTTTFERALRDIAAAAGKEVELRMEGMETHLDRVVIEGIRDGLVHLLRNAVAHGLESPEERRRSGKPARGRVEVRAEQRGDSVAIEVSDDGRGVAPDLIARGEREGSLAHVLAEAGLSTTTDVTDVSGRGVGLNAVLRHVQALRGSLEISSEPGKGTTASLLLPLSLALMRVLVARRGGQTICIPLAHVDEVVSVKQERSLLGSRAVELHGDVVPLVDLVEALGGSATTIAAESPAVVVGAGGRRVAVACDSVDEDRDVLLKSMGPLLDELPGYLACTIMGDGRPALVADPRFLTSAAGVAAEPGQAAAEPGVRTVLVVDDQFAVRELQKSILETAGYRVVTAHTGREALERLQSGQEVDGVLTDIEMPEMDGLELIEAIRRQPELSDLSVIVVTSKAGAEDERRGVEAGADAYIVKESFDQQTLLETVERLIGP